MRRNLLAYISMSSLISRFKLLGVFCKIKFRFIMRLSCCMCSLQNDCIVLFIYLKLVFRWHFVYSLYCKSLCSWTYRPMPRLASWFVEKNCQKRRLKLLFMFKIAVYIHRYTCNVNSNILIVLYSWILCEIIITHLIGSINIFRW